MHGKSRRRSAAPVSAENGAEELAWLALKVGRLASGDPGGRGLRAAQWAALRYLARANRFSRTVSALAEFQGTTRGTVSQTIKGLVARGFLRRSPSDRDGRSVRFDLTPAARQVLDRDPFLGLVRTAAALPAAERNRALESLQLLLRGATPPEPVRRLGRCAFCGHLRGGQADGVYQCGLLEEPLVAAELAEHCMRFSPRPA